MDQHPDQKSEPAGLPPLSVEEDAFALALIEYNGNLKAAYLAVFGEDTKAPLAQARLLAAQPNVSARVRQILFAGEEHALVSAAAHLAELAEIRDMAKKMGAVKVALGAEEARGKVAGFYKEQKEGVSELELELAKDARALSMFVQGTLAKLADSLPV